MPGTPSATSQVRASIHPCQGFRENAVGRILKSRWCAALAGLVCLVGGCTSFSTSMLNRLDDNSFVGNSNGDPCRKCQTRPYKGIPITLQVPSHVDVYIEETYFLQEAEESTADRTILEEAPIGRLFGVRAEVIKSKKVFLVDFKRPASGTLDLDASFSDQQYFKSIASKLEDTTIQESAKLVGTVLKFATGKSTAADAAVLPNTVLRKSRVTAYRRFDINEPGYEQQLEAFVNQQLGVCDRNDHLSVPVRESAVDQ